MTSNSLVVKVTMATKIIRKRSFVTFVCVMSISIILVVNLITNARILKTLQEPKRKLSLVVDPPAGYDCETYRNIDTYNNVENIDLLKTHERIVYNRIPKTGSMVARELMETCFARLGYNITHYTSIQPVRLAGVSDDLLRHTSKQLDAIQVPWLFIGHVHFIDFTQYGMSHQPLYVNLVREPVSSFVSEYYFLRFKHPRPMSDNRRNMTFDECVFTNDPECSSYRNITRLIPYFCGREEYCTTDSIKGLSIAKQNILKYYSVVGYLEYIREFYTALEFMIPHVFSGITKLFDKRGAIRAEVSKGTNKMDASESALREFRSRVPHEIELYNFIRQRFDCLVKQIRERQINFNYR